MAFGGGPTALHGPKDHLRDTSRLLWCRWSVNYCRHPKIHSLLNLHSTNPRYLPGFIERSLVHNSCTRSAVCCVIKLISRPLGTKRRRRRRRRRRGGGVYCTNPHLASAVYMRSCAVTCAFDSGSSCARARRATRQNRPMQVGNSLGSRTSGLSRLVAMFTRRWR